MSSFRRWLLFLAAVALPVLDVGTLFLLSQWIGVGLTLGLVALSTALGLLSCRRWIVRLSRENEVLKKESGATVPPEVIFVQGGEALLSFVAMLCFLFPGLLSDLIGFFLALPRIQRGFTDKVVAKVRDEAAARGQTVEQYLMAKKGTCRP